MPVDKAERTLLLNKHTQIEAETSSCGIIWKPDPTDNVVAPP